MNDLHCMYMQQRAPGASKSAAVEASDDIKLRLPALQDTRDTGSSNEGYGSPSRTD
jgi:hypothetical protein